MIAIQQHFSGLAGRRGDVPLLKAVVLFAVALVLLWIGLDPYAINVYDEGVIVYGAQRILQGEVPYRDFWGLYPPGQFLAVAALFKAFGSSLLVERAWDTVLRAAIAALVYLIAARLAGRGVAMIVWILALGWLWAVEFYGYSMIPALLLVLLSAWFFIRFLESQTGMLALFAAGLFVGGTIAFRHDVAAYVYLAEVLTLLALAIAQRAPAAGPSFGKGVRQLALDLVALSAGAVVAALPLALYLIIAAPPADVLDQLIVFPATVYTHVRHLPYPSPFEPSLIFGFPLYFHFFVLAGALVFLIRLRPGQDGGMRPDLWRVVMFLVLLTGLVFVKSTVKPHVVHLVHVMILASLLAGVLLSVVARGPLGAAVKVCLALALCLMAVVPVMSVRGAVARAAEIRAHLAEIEQMHHFPRASGLLTPPDQGAALEYVRAQTAPDEKIFVGNGRHDRVVSNDVIFYFLAERPSATKYHELHPGQVTTEPVQRAIIDELQRNGVRCVVLFTGSDSVVEPNASGISSNVTLLDGYIASRYQVVKELGSYKVLKRAQ
jgi:hypothetical protein